MRLGSFRASARLLTLALPLAGFACSSSTDSSSTPVAPAPETEAPVEEEATPESMVEKVFGKGDGTAASVTFVTVYEAGATAALVDLAFNPKVPGQAWVLGYDSMVHIGEGLDGDSPKWTKKKDPAALHFMHKPTAIAMGDNGFWGTCGNGDNSAANRTPNYFMGPALFTTDLSVFAIRTPEGLGSHYDMLHATPFCRGIAHATGNEYWAFNGYDGAIDRNDFNADHGPGADDHSDGEIYRYAAGQVKAAADDTSSHLVYDPIDKFLYIADTGNARIVKLDTTKGKMSGDLPRVNEPLEKGGMMPGTNVEEVVPPGVLEKPSGLELRGDLLFVTDAATSTFIVFDKTGKEMRRLATGLPADSLGGFVFGPDGKIWFADRKAGKVVRIEPK